MSGAGSLSVFSLPSKMAARRGRVVNVSCAANKGRKEVRGRAKESRLSSSSARRIGFGAEGRKEEKWRCIEGCGACCKLDKGPSFATPEEIFENPSDVQLYRSLMGTDGWCVHFEKTTRTCSIYSDRPYFCRVEPQIFQDLYGISEKKFNKEACSFCRDTIKAIHGAHSMELDKFNRKELRCFCQSHHSIVHTYYSCTSAKRSGSVS